MSTKVKVCTKCNNEISENEDFCSSCEEKTPQKTIYTFEAKNGIFGFGIRGTSSIFKTDVMINGDNTIEISKYKGRYGQISKKLKQKKYWKIKREDISAVKIERKPQIPLMMMASLFLVAGVVLTPMYFILLAVTFFGMIQKSMVLQLKNNTDIEFYTGKDTETTHEFMEELGTNIGNIRKGGIFKKAWFYILVILCALMVLIIGALNSEDLSTKEQEQSDNNYSEDISYDEDYIGIDTPYGLYFTISSNMTPDEDLYFELNDKATAFLTDNPSLFPSKSLNACEQFTDDSITYFHIAKNDDRYGDKLMYLPFLEVVQIDETEIEDGMYFTGLNVSDGENQYYIYYNDELPDVFEGEYILVYGLPLSMGQFSNTDGGSTLCPIIAGSYIDVIE